MRNSETRTVALAAGAVTLLTTPSKHRMALTLSPHLTTGYTADASLDVAENRGLVITAGGGCVALRFEEHGAIVQRGWYAYCASPITISVLETFEA